MLKNKGILLFFICLTMLFYWKVFLLNLSLFPGDLQVGAYFPWLEYKWGYTVGVPIKNGLISDIFSQFFVWKALISESFKSGTWPLWNPYSYSGYPLLANFNSGALNPFNLLMTIFGNKKGWNLMIVSQTLGILASFYLYMRAMKLSSHGSVVAAITAAFSGFILVWLPFVNIGFSFIWLSLILLSVENFFLHKESKYLLYMSPLLFLLMSAGHFQGLVFACLMLSFYFLYRLYPNYRSFKTMFIFVFSIVLGVLMMSVQLLPTIELMTRSVRFTEGYIVDYGYGLLPAYHLLTFLSPDYFGNVSTNNYWGAFNYHETVIYTGVFALLSISGAIYKFKELRNFKFFFFSLFISVVLIIDTFPGRAVYEYNVPLISTSAAGRISFIIAFSASALSGWWFDQLRKLKFTSVVRLNWFWPIIYLVLFGLSFYIYRLYLPHSDTIPFEIEKAKIAWRNVIYPFAILSCLLFAILFFRKTKFFSWLVILIIALDLFRFGWKYLPFVSSEFVFPTTPDISFVQQQPGVFRIEREKAQILPPNTWAGYRLSSPSGYDPMAAKDYSVFYNRFFNRDKDGYASRYSELDYYDAKKLGELNVKYFFALRRDEESSVVHGGENLFYKIDLNDWNIIYQTQTVKILENKFFRDRAFVINNQGSTDIKKYSPDEVVINYSARDDSQLVLMDYNYPGWKAYVNFEEVKIDSHMEVFRKVNIPKGEGIVTFIYRPRSFYWGLRISLCSLLVWMIIYKFTTR